jgi:CRISPR-associated endonuclease/helicase Cas3
VLADGGLQEVLRAPTGAGKTVAAVLPWLWRRRRHPDATVRRSTPHWLVVALPLRTLVEQTVDSIRSWLANLDLSTEVGLHVIMGGEGRAASQWRRSPEQDAIFVGSIDMLLSRALNRGYAMSPFRWPIDFGMFNNGCQWVFDEVQLMGPALATSRQLQRFRATMGTYLPMHTMWMSATLDPDQLRTVDAPEVGDILDLDPDDVEPELARRLRATRRLGRLDMNNGRAELADAVVAEHRAGSRTIVMVNTVRRAQVLYTALRDRTPPARLVLVHSRFRPPDRLRATRRALADPGEEGTIVVTTQALEAGVDVSSATLITEVAPWPSIVQRAGRCNRYGEQTDARLLWTAPPDAAPYDDADLVAARTALEEREGEEVAGADLAAARVAVAAPVHAVLRRKDIVELFDTAPDLSGGHVDVGRFIRDAEDIDVRVAWRRIASTGADPTRIEDLATPTRNELCPAPVGSVRTLLRGSGDALLWRHDHLQGAWLRVRRADEVHPGMVLVADARLGKYTPETGWDTTRSEPVEPVVPAPADDAAPVDESFGDDRLSHLGVWVPLADHLAHAEEAAGALLSALGDGVLPPDIEHAVRVAARYHDLGKAHDVFQDTMRRSAGDHEREMADSGGPWAKSSKWRKPKHRRRGFSHELAGALALLSPEGQSLFGDVAERGLVVYLVAAHHGRVRLGIRSLPGERGCPDDERRMSALGVCDQDVLASAELPGGERFEGTVIDLSPMLLGGERSWSAAAMRLRDRPDLGVFRLGFLEALVVLADWRASAAEEAETA